MTEAFEMILTMIVLIAAVGGLGYFLVKHVGSDDDQD